MAALERALVPRLNGAWTRQRGVPTSLNRYAKLDESLAGAKQPLVACAAMCFHFAMKEVRVWYCWMNDVRIKQLKEWLPEVQREYRPGN